MIARGDRTSHAIQARSEETDRATYQAMEALVHNLNTMHSRAGAQIPFSSHQLRHGHHAGRAAWSSATCCWPPRPASATAKRPSSPSISSRSRKGVNYNPGDPNYDLFKLACRVSAKRLFPNFSFIDAPFNLKYYKPGDPNTEVAYMGCRTRVMANVLRSAPGKSSSGGATSRFTSINLPRIGDPQPTATSDFFFEELDRKIDLVIDQLLDRFEIQCRKAGTQLPLPDGAGRVDRLGQAWPRRRGAGGAQARHPYHRIHRPGRMPQGPASATITAKAEEAQNLGLEIVGYMRKTHG